MFSFIKKTLEGRSTDRIACILLGALLLMAVGLPQLDKLTDEKELSHTKILSLQSCYYSAVKFGKMDPKMSEIFCNQYSDDMTQTYSSLQQQMNKIMEKKYQIISFE